MSIQGWIQAQKCEYHGHTVMATTVRVPRKPIRTRQTTIPTRAAGTPAALPADDREAGERPPSFTVQALCETKLITEQRWDGVPECPHTQTRATEN